MNRCYKTDYAGDKEIVNDWFKVLKNYELQDITAALENYMKYNTAYAPKVYDLVRNCASIEYKKRLVNAKTRCMFCMQVIDFNDTKHEDRCRSIQTIKSAAARFKNQEIDEEKYRKMGDEEFDKYYLAAVKLIAANTTNAIEKNTWEKYLKSVE